jgi:hypothetical protein
MTVYEIFKSTEVAIPFSQAFIYISLITIFMLFGKLKFALITTYMFSCYWGFILNNSYFISKAGGVQSALFIYGFFGFLMLALTIYSFFFQEY